MRTRPPNPFVFVAVLGGVGAAVAAGVWASVGPRQSSAALTPAAESPALAPGSKAGYATNGQCWGPVQPGGEAGKPTTWSVTRAGRGLWATGVGEEGDRQAARFAYADGTTWSQAPGPALPPGAFLGPVAAATARDDLWVFGSVPEGMQTHVLALHWDGSAWHESLLPTQGDQREEVRAALAVGPSDVWAAGASSGAASGSILLYHWDGAHWSDVAAPDVSPTAGIGALSGTGSADVWAVGSQAQDESFLLHWDGSAWKRVALPARRMSLVDVAAVGAADVWVAGTTDNHHALIYHWDGRDWREVPTGVPGEQESFLQALAVVGPGDLWALGILGAYTDHHALLLHWNGRAWAQSPPPPFAGAVLSTLVAAGSSLWVAGMQVEPGTNLSTGLLERRQGAPCPPDPEASPTAPTGAANALSLPGPVPTAAVLVGDRGGAPGRYLLEFRSTSPNAIYAYDPDRKQERMISRLPGTGYEVSSLSGDGQMVAWVQNHAPEPMEIHDYDLTSGRESTIKTGSGASERFGRLASAAGVLYYEDIGFPASSQSGLYAHDLATRQETLVSAQGWEPVAGDRFLLWSERQDFPSPTPDPHPPTASAVTVGPDATEDSSSHMWIAPPQDCTLHLRRLDRSAPDRTIAHTACSAADPTGSGGFAGYAGAGDHVVWATANPEASVTLYTISTGTNRILARGAADPIIAENMVVWTSTGGGAGGAPEWQLYGYRFDDGHILPIRRFTDGPVHALFRLDAQTLVFAHGTRAYPAAPGFFTTEIPEGVR